jgi:putative FmdB family regulatory protein
MPTYEYACSNGHRFEVFQRMSDEPVAKCAECGEPATRVISGGAGFLFKGEGFYITDYRSDDYRKKASAEKGAGGEGATGGSTKGSDAGTAKSDAPKAASEPAAKPGSTGSDKKKSKNSSSKSGD